MISKPRTTQLSHYLPKEQQKETYDDHADKNIDGVFHAITILPSMIAATMHMLLDPIFP